MKALSGPAIAHAESKIIQNTLLGNTSTLVDDNGKRRGDPRVQAMNAPISYASQVGNHGEHVANSGCNSVVEPVKCPKCPANRNGAAYRNIGDDGSIHSAMLACSHGKDPGERGTDFHSGPLQAYSLRLPH